MHKVLFITRYPLFGKYNLKTKFDGQMSALRHLGYDVYFFAYDERYYYLVHQGERTPIMRVFATRTGFYHHILSYILLYLSVIRVLRTSKWSSNDYAYIRSMPKELFWRIMKKKMQRLGVFIIVEKPTYIRDGREKPRWYIHFLSNFLSLFGKDKYTNLYTLIGDKTDGTYNGSPAINIDNGIDVSSISPRTPIPHTGINMIAVGHMADWHGFDRVIEGLAHFPDKKEIHFYIVGPDGDGSLEKWKHLTKELNMQDIIHFTGPLYGEELGELMNHCDVAFASLGMYRKNCNSSSELKIREYFSRGLPIVYAANDTVLDSYASLYVKKIPNDSRPVDIEEIIHFVKSLPKDTLLQDMRNYAEQYMSWDVQFKKVFEYLKTN